MFEIDLYRDRQQRDWVTGPASAQPATLPAVALYDTMRIGIHSLERNPNTLAENYFLEVPWSFTEIRASLGLIDAACDSGTFKLKVGSETTATLTWPSSLATAAEISAWKTTVLNALKALSGIGANGVRLEEPANTPAHFLYFTWLDVANSTPIEVVSVALTPLCLPEVLPLRDAPAYQQLVKLTQAPIALTTAFAFPNGAPPTVVSVRTGGAGTNAVQMLTVPDTADGGLELRWSGAPTKLLTTPGLSAAKISAALNSIVADGATNPSFRVDALKTGGRYNIEFIGPLAAAAQSLIEVEIRGAADPIVAYGQIALTNARFVEALNGRSDTKVKFAVTITDDDGPDTIIRELKLLANPTNPGTAQSLDEASAIITRETIVYVDNSTTTPIATVAAGISYIPAAAASVFSITHNLATRQPNILVYYKSSLSPEYWIPLALNSVFTWTATDANHVDIRFAYELSSDTGSPLYFGRYKLFIASPDSTVKLLAHLHSFLEVTDDGTGGGQTLAAKLAALEAAIGIVSGAISIAAGNITGKLKADQIDLDALSVALKTTAAFLETLRALVSDSTIIDTIAEKLAASAKFLETLIAVATSADFLKAFVPALLDDPTFDTGLREKVLDALQGGAQLPPGTIPFFFDAFALQLPPVHELVTASRLASAAGSTTKAVQVTDGGVITTTTSTGPSTILASDNEPAYELLPCAIVSYTTGATIAGSAKLSDWSDGQVRTCSAAVQLRTIGARRGRTFPTGTILGRKNGIVFPVRLASPIAWPTEMEATFLRTTKITSDLLAASSRFAMAFQLHAQLAGPANGAIQWIIERGVPSAAATDDLYQFAWTSIALVEIPLDDALGVHSFEVSVTRASGGGLTGEVKKWGRASAWTPPSLPFALRARSFNFDIEDIASAKGSLLLRRPAFTASIANT